jgi:hypothetical protein
LPAAYPGEGTDFRPNETQLIYRRPLKAPEPLMVTLLNRDSAPGKWRDRGLPAFAEPPSCKNYGEPGATAGRQWMSRIRFQHKETPKAVAHHGWQA